MKMKILTVFAVLTFGLASATPVLASTKTDPAIVGADALVGRPLCFAVTVVGSAVFVVTLPFSAPSGSIHSAAEALVLKPARETFVRPLGDFSYPPNDSDQYMYSRAPGKKAQYHKAR
jgi:hypothetical protein